MTHLIILTTLKSLDYNVVMTFSFNNNNNNFLVCVNRKMKKKTMQCHWKCSNIHKILSMLLVTVRRVRSRLPFPCVSRKLEVGNTFSHKQSNWGYQEQRTENICYGPQKMEKVNNRCCIRDAAVLLFCCGKSAGWKLLTQPALLPLRTVGHIVVYCMFVSHCPVVCCILF